MKQLNNMKVYKYINSIICLMFLFATTTGTTQAQDTTIPKTELRLSYFLPVNKVPYLEVNSRKKVGRKFEPVKNIPVSIYFGQASPDNLLGKVTTDFEGKARIGLPPSFQNTWDSLNEFTFIAEGLSAEKDPLTTEVTVKKAILTIDTSTADGTRMVTAELKEKSGNDWVAVKDIDMTLAVKRLLGNLPVGDKDAYTSDSTGISTAEFKRDSIPGDEKGHIILVAQVVDNDTYGNLVAEKSVNWGTAGRASKDFFAQRALWSVRAQTPLWLLFTVYTIVIGVWGTIIYLLFQILRMKRLGNINS